ncbi:DUF5711 family protein [Litchfieldia sinesaloumensis]|uniref:DUF5711 family protein n=1 Tax=Litchfieldia sinesaloumensis TaxID=1926280 RepID=UPI0009886CD4|nr:DUF5711 family protein [Bacillus sinesaloumensis]
MVTKHIKSLFLLLIFALVFISNLSVHAESNQSFMVENKTNITSIDVNHDSSKFAVGTYGATVYVYNASGEIINEFQADNVITGISFLQDDSLLISSDDRKLYYLDSQGELVWIKSFDLPVKTVASSTDGSIITVYLSGSSEMILLNHEGEVTGTVNTGFTLNTLSVSENGEWLVSGGADQFIRVFDKSGEKLNEIPADGIINDISISNEGEIVVGSDNSYIYLMNQEGTTTASVQVDWKITSVDITSNGDYIAASDMRGYNYLVNHEGEVLWKQQGEGIARAVAFGGNGENLYTGSAEGMIQLFNVSSAIEEVQKGALVKTIVIISIIVLGVLALGVILWQMKRRNKTKVFKAIWKAKYNYLVLLPSIVLIAVFLYYPAVTGFVYSFFEWNPGGKSHFIGLDNFRKMFHDEYVIEGLKNLFIIMVSGIVKFMIPPLIVAELLYFLSSKASAYWFRTVFVASMILPGVASLLIWQNIYSYEDGLLNEFLTIIGLGSYTEAWLANPDTSLWAIIFIGFPFISILHLLVYYAGLISIPSELKDAAMIDGANTYRIIRSIHLPLLSGQFKLLIVMTIISLIQDFNAMLIVTGGGPGTSTYVPALQMYYAATKFSDMGYASAIGVLMFFMIFIFTLINLKFVKSSEH